MSKPIIVFSHERSGTHLLINLINYLEFGKFYTIGYNDNLLIYNKENYKKQVIVDLIINKTNEFKIYKSHHQVQFFDGFFDFLITNYKIIYIKREIKDVLTSYYRFLKNGEKNFPKIEEWVFSNPDEIGKKYIIPYYPDPHVLVDPINYLDRWILHLEGWMKYKNDILILNYEDILLSFNYEKQKIENFIEKKICDKIIEIKDQNYPNFSPNKGIIGAYKEEMSISLVEEINNYYKIKK